MILTARRKKWLEDRKKPPVMKGTRLIYPSSTEREIVKRITSIVDEMGDLTMAAMVKAFSYSELPSAAQIANDLSVLSDRYRDSFNKDAIFLTDKLAEDSAINLRKSLKELSGGITIDTRMLSGELSNKFAAITADNASLFKTIPSVYFDQVQQAVMDSIVTGNGLVDLMPFFESKNPGIHNYAKHRALDQTRKAYTSINFARMEAAGIDEFEWMHSNGSPDPRKLHQELDGKIFKLSNLPYIGDMYGQKIYGIPGQLPNCRCTARPVFRFIK